MFAQFVGMMSAIRLSGLSGLTVVSHAENIGNDVAAFRAGSAKLHTESNLDMRLTLRIGIILRILP